MSIATDVHNALFKICEEYFDPHIKKVELNYTRYGTVTAVLGNNQYTVKINNLPYTIPGTTMPVSQYYVGDVVMVEIVNNDFSFKYIKCKKPY